MIKKMIWKRWYTVVTLLPDGEERIHHVQTHHHFAACQIAGQMDLDYWDGGDGGDDDFPCPYPVAVFVGRCKSLGVYR